VHPVIRPKTFIGRGELQFDGVHVWGPFSVDVPSRRDGNDERHLRAGPLNEKAALSGG